MDFGLLAASILLALAAGWSFALLQRLRDWRAIIVIGWLGAMLVLLVMTVRGQFVLGDGTRPGPHPIIQAAISGLAIAAALFFHHVFQHDALTGLASRPLFLKRLALALRRTRRGQIRGFAVLSVDLDRFKMINDSLGHDVADEFIMVVSKRFQACVRPGDVVARLGGDKFAFLLTDVDEAQAAAAAQRVVEALERHIVLGHQEVTTTASMGIALATRHTSERPDQLVRQADLARAQAKDRGTSRYEIFDDSMHLLAVERLRLEADLRRAVEQGELRLYFQPIVALVDRRLVGFEALLRWQHPVRGLIMPDEFLSVAEETGLVVPLGAWVLGTACRQAKEWLKRHDGAKHLVFHVNLSGKQFAQADLCDQVRGALATSRIPARSLGLEITESVAMEDAEQATETLRQLRELGVKLQIDDFGTGYSSLSYLGKFPIDTLKIDRSFVMKMRKNDDNTKIVRAIVSLARDLELDVIAEGIERPSHLRYLTDFGCRLGQGKLLCEPVDAESAERLITEGRIGGAATVKAG